MGAFKDLTGEQIGRQKVLNIAYRKNGKIYYHCQCQCENKTEKDIQAQHLKEKRSLSCGCLRKELLSQSMTKDFIIGQKIGKQTIIKKDENNNSKKVHQICQCDCGTIRSVDGCSLRNGNSKSCGCTKSQGEEKISEILIKNNIPFEREKKFDNCIYLDTNFHAKFDFQVNNKYIIEYDGKQHYGVGGQNRENNFKIIQQHDDFKNKYCKENNIAIIRIPYTQYKILTLEDLIPETSKFLIKEEDKNE